MLLSIFSILYELIIGNNSDYPEYRDGIFDSVGLISLVVALGFCFVFYVVLGQWKAIWYTKTHWLLTVLIVAVFGFGFAYSQAKGITGDYDSYVVRFSFVNGVYSALYFVGFSFLLKNFSIFSKHTPI